MITEVSRLLCASPCCECLAAELAMFLDYCGTNRIVEIECRHTDWFDRPPLHIRYLFRIPHHLDNITSAI